MTDYLVGPMSQPTQQEPIPQPAQPMPWPRPAAPISGPLSQLSVPTPPAWPQLTAEPQQPKSNTALIVVTVVLFVAAALSGTLYITADRDRDAAVAQLADHRTDLEHAKEQVASTAEEASLAERDNTALTDENATLQTCVDAVKVYLWDGLGEQESRAALDRMWSACQ